MNLRVVIADDDLRVRAALRAVLDDDSRFLVTAEADNSADAISETARVRPDIVLLDVRMPGGGVEAAQAIRDSDDAVVIVAVTANADADTVARMIGAGANGVLCKGRLGNLGDLLERCHGGEMVLATPAARAGMQRLKDYAA